MLTDAYTPDAICQCLGLPGFEADAALTTTGESLRFLLMPSFHPEVCITITDGRVSVVAARTMIWHQSAPAPVFTDGGEGEVTDDVFSTLISALTEATIHTTQGSGIAIDGMPVNSLLVRAGFPTSRFRQNVGLRSPFAAVVGSAISASWECLRNVYCRNALATAGRYAGLNLATLSEPPRKPTVQTLVLGPEEERTQLLEALKKHHDG